MVSAAFSAGLLEQALDTDVNLVNAEVLLKDRGIELVDERLTEIGDFSNLITAEVLSNERAALAAGTLFGHKMPRLVQKGDFRLESPMEGTLMLTSHQDTPGVIGKIGEVCGRYQVNIAYLSVGRSTLAPGGEAMGVLVLDSTPPPAALAEIERLEPILGVWIVNFPPAGQLPRWLGGTE